jgi:hypothetical protein
MNNSMIPEVAAGIVTSVAIILFVAVNIVRFNKHLKIH